MRSGLSEGNEKDGMERNIGSPTGSGLERTSSATMNLRFLIFPGFFCTGESLSSRVLLSMEGDIPVVMRSSISRWL